MALPAHRVRSRHGLFWRAFADWLLGAYRHPWLWITNILVLPAVILCAWLYLTTEETWRKQEEQDLLVAARLASRILQEELRAALTIERALATRPTFLDAVRHRDASRAGAALAELLEMNPSMDRAVLVDPDGTLWVERKTALADSSPLPAMRLGALEDVPPAGWHGAISSAYVDEATGTEKLVSLSHPVQDGERLLGLLQVQYRLQRVGAWLEKVRIEPEGFLYVVDQQGLLVTYPFQVLPGKPKNVSSWLPVAGAASTHGTLIRFRQGTPARAWTAVMVRLEPFGWRVIAQQPDAALLGPFHQLAVSCFGFLLAMVGLVAVLLARWARLHRTTLALMAKQASLLRRSEQRRTLAFLRAKEPPSTRTDAR